MCSPQKKSLPMSEITVWTKQNIAVLDQLERSGRFITDERYIRRELGDTAEIMLFTYRWLADHIPDSGSRPEDAVYPVWVSFIKEATMMPEPGFVILELKVDTDDVTAIDIMKWTKITNYSYLQSDAEDGRTHNALLREIGTDSAKAVMTQFYPVIRGKIIDSWDRLFDPPGKPGDPGCYGLIWEVRKEWIQRILT